MSARGEGWRRVVQLVRTCMADVVVVRHYDRLYRTTRDLVELVDLAEETGVGAAVAERAALRRAGSGRTSEPETPPTRSAQLISPSRATGEPQFAPVGPFTGPHCR
ncbi:recombinase family protein [Streptomyces sp. NPDC087787]|uniref:recombinase family protein n=1 Tax=Streptomyces sp. NPDC087787 TaxID=3365803 RepID=UPI0038160898